MFGAKVECDGCNRKLKQRDAMYHRGSYFCSAECRETWTKANPPRMAQGTAEELKRELVRLVDTALAERDRAHGDLLTDAAVGAIPMVGGMLRRNAAMDRSCAQDEAARYQHEILAIMNALGYDAEARVVNSPPPGQNNSSAITNALISARQRALSSGPLH